MNLAKISSNGQITVPVEIRRQLGLKSGDKILFLQKPDGEIVISNASAQAIRKAQAAFSGVAEEIGVYNEEDVQALVDEVRYKYPVFRIALSRFKTCKGSALCCSKP